MKKSFTAIMIAKVLLVMTSPKHRYQKDVIVCWDPTLALPSFPSRPGEEWKKAALHHGCFHGSNDVWNVIYEGRRHVTRMCKNVLYSFKIDVQNTTTSFFS